MKKKLMAIAMTAAMVGSLTACGGGAKETTAALENLELPAGVNIVMEIK